MPLIEVDGLTFKYLGRRVPTLQGISLQIEHGETALLLGPSGCGKSTLALAMNGAIPHAISGDLSGTVYVDGIDTRRASMSDLAGRVGIVFQDPEAQFCMVTVEDEVAFGLENLTVPRSQMDVRIDAALGAVGLAHRRQEQVSRLSGGQKQRLALACVLALEPSVIVLDEPTAQLDPAGAAEVIDILRRLRESGSHTLVIIEHRLDEVVPLVDRTIVFSEDGRIVANGQPRAVLREHGRELAATGVWTPQVSELALRLEADGLRLDPFPISVPEAASSLRPYLARLQELTERQPRLLPPMPKSASEQRPGYDAAVTCRGDASITTVAGRAQQSSVLQLEQASGRIRPTPFGSGGEGRLIVRNLTYQYPRAATATLTGVSMRVDTGEFVAVVGANGAGKSTLARLIAGIVRPPAGAILFDGQDAANLPQRELARKVGYVFQYPEHQFVGQTVLDDVAYGLRQAGQPESPAEELARAMLADFGLLPLAGAHPFTLSHGEQRRLSVASMLVLGQRLLLLDEPTFGQDQKNAMMLLDKLEALTASGIAIVAITHDMRLVAERAARVLVVGRGAILFDGTPASLFADAELLADAHLLPPPLWDLSRRLGLSTPLPRLDRLATRSSLEPATASAIGGAGAT